MTMTTCELKTPRVLVDMDGALAQWDRRFIEGMCAADPAYPFKKVGARKGYDVTGSETDSWAEHVFPVMQTPGFYKELLPYPGARKALEGMRAAGWDVWICTTNDVRNPTGADDKIQWISEHLGDWWTKRVVLTQDKTLVHGDVLIDDKPLITGARTPDWQHVLFAQSYNRNVDRIRLNRWCEWSQLQFFNLVDGELTVIKAEKESVAA